MRRDFTEATKTELLKYLDDMSQESIWEKVWDGIKAFVSFPWLRFLDSFDMTGEAEIKEYHKAIGDAKVYSKSEINTIFEMANDKDRRDAGKLKIEREVAVRILREIESLTEIISPTGSLQNISAFKGALKELEENSPLEIKDGKLATKVDPITDKEILDHALGDLGDIYHNIHRNVSDVLGKIGIGTVILIALFNHKEINLQNMLKSSDGKLLFQHMRAEIIKGRKGYDSIKSIAEKLDVEEEYVKYLLDEMENPGRRAIKPKHLKGYSYQDDLLYKKQINDIIYANISKAIEDPEFIKDMCEQAGLDPELTKLILDEGGVDGYEFSQYKKHVAEAVAAACGKLDDQAADIKGYQEYLDISKSLFDLAEDNKLEEMLDKWRTGDVNKSELENFLKQNCGYKKVTLKDIEDLEDTFEFVDKFDLFTKGSKYAVWGYETVSHLIADYTYEINLLENMMASKNDNPAYQMALYELKNEYENKWTKVLGDVVDQAAGTIAGKVTGAVPGLSLAEAAVDLAGKMTGAEGYASAAQEIIGLSSIVPETVDTYYEALERLRTEGQSPEAFMDVRISFEMMKQSSINYYEAQIRYAEGVFPGTSDYDSYIDYLEDELSRIKKMEIGSKYKPRSYETYLSQ